MYTISPQCNAQYSQWKIQPNVCTQWQPLKDFIFSFAKQTKAKSFSCDALQGLDADITHPAVCAAALN